MNFRLHGTESTPQYSSLPVTDHDTTFLSSADRLYPILHRVLRETHTRIDGHPCLFGLVSGVVVPRAYRWESRRARRDRRDSHRYAEILWFYNSRTAIE